jgi:hypothetical protein
VGKSPQFCLCQNGCLGLQAWIIGMEKTLEEKMNRNEALRIEAAIVKYNKALIWVFAEMKKDQAEIEKLRIETRTILMDLKSRISSHCI